MPTATADRGWRLLVVVPVLVAVAIGTFVALRPHSSGSSAGGSAAEEAGAAAVVPVSAASIYDFGGLDELVKASDLVVRVEWRPPAGAGRSGTTTTPWSRAS